MGYNTYGQRKVTRDVPLQVWAEVRGVKHGGGVIDATEFAKYATGDVIPAGTPVYLDKSGGTLTPVYFYEVLEAVTTSDTEVLLKGAFPLAATGYIMIAPSTAGGAGKGVAYTDGTVVSKAKFTHSVAITANALGAMAAGTILAVADSAHASTSIPLNPAIPNGLLLHDIVKVNGDTWATGGVVDEGRIFEDRIVGGVPRAYKLGMPEIKFEKGI